METDRLSWGPSRNWAEPHEPRAETRWFLERKKQKNTVYNISWKNPGKWKNGKVSMNSGKMEKLLNSGKYLAIFRKNGKTGQMPNSKF